MRPSSYAAIALLTLVACKREAPASARIGDSTVPPPSIQALVVMSALDSAVSGVQPVEVILPPEGKAEPRKLRLWRLEDRPVKLVVTEPNESGQMTGTSTWYFQRDTIVAARAPHAGYAFDQGRLVEWMDENGTVLETKPAALQARDADLKKAASEWLARF